MPCPPEGLDQPFSHGAGSNGSQSVLARFSESYGLDVSRGATAVLYGRQRTEGAVAFRVRAIVEAFF